MKDEKLPECPTCRLDSNIDHSCSRSICLAFRRRKKTKRLPKPRKDVDTPGTGTKAPTPTRSALRCRTASPRLEA